MIAPQPIWQQILSEEGRRNFGLTTGPTIPFLVGVYHYYHKLNDEELKSEVSIKKVFDEILESGQGIVGITICPGLGVEVVRNAQSQSHNPITNENIEEWCKRLWKDYGKYISAQEFSCDKIDHSWRRFVPNEITKIETIKI